MKHRFIVCLNKSSPNNTTYVLIQIAINHLGVAVAPKAYDDFEKSPFAGLPSPSIDASWHYLLEPTTIRVTSEELAQSNQTSVTLPGGGYMAWLGVFHELHCIVSCLYNMATLS